MSARARVRPCAALVAALVGFAGCGINRIDVPVSFTADRRLSIQSPSPEADVTLPLTVTWRAEDFALEGGNHFGLFVDRPPVPTDRVVRRRVCTEQEKLPPQLGEFRKVCKDDRLTVFFADTPSFEFACFEPRFSAPERVRNTHTVTVVLLDGEGRRVGQAGETVKFNVDDEDADRCRGL